MGMNNKKRVGNENNTIKVLLVIVLIALLGVIVYGVYTVHEYKVSKLNQQVARLNAELAAAKKQNQQPTTTYKSKRGVKVEIYSPKSDAKVTSPLIVIGRVPGSWSFEASFPVQLKGSKGNIIKQASAQLFGDWMTDQLVSFSAKLEYSSTETGVGTLVLQKDNPSGNPENDDSVIIPVKL